jgi:hypothetical protein
MDAEQDLAPAAVSPGPPALLHWRSLGDGLLVGFLIAGPTLYASFVLRDQRERVWMPILVIAAVGLLVGGAIAGRHRRTPRGALTQGVVVGFVTATVIVIADIIRHAALGRGISSHTVGLWLGVEVGAVLIAGLGGLIGRIRYLRSRKKRAGLK